MKIDAAPLKKVLKKIEESLSIIAEAPTRVARLKKEADDRKAKLDPDDEAGIRLWRSMDDRAEISKNIAIRTEEDLPELSDRAEKLIEELGEQLAGAGRDEAIRLRDEIVRAIRPWCPKIVDAEGVATDTAEISASGMPVLNTIPQSRNDPRIVGEIQTASDFVRADAGRYAAAVLEAGNRVISSHTAWEAAGEKFFTGFRQ